MRKQRDGDWDRAVSADGRQRPCSTFVFPAIKWIAMESGQDSHDHLLDPGQIFHYAMAKQ
jgi:hypothetical protein